MNRVQRFGKAPVHQRNPTRKSTVCVRVYVQEGRKRYSAEPSPEDMAHFWRMSPIAHISKVQGPMIFMLGAKDRRVSDLWNVLL